MPTRKASAWLICLSFYTWAGSGEKVSYKAGQEAGLLGRIEPDLACSKTGFPGWLSSKESASNKGDSDSIPGLGRSPGGGNGAHSSILAWRIPQTEEPDSLQSMGSQRGGHDGARMRDWNYGCTGIQDLIAQRILGLPGAAWPLGDFPVMPLFDVFSFYPRS